MRQTPRSNNQAMRRISDPLKTLSTAFLLVIPVLIFPACASSPRRTAHVETWRIDPYGLELYRRISPLEEDVISISSNPDAEKFLCIPTEQMPEVILEMNR